VTTLVGTYAPAGEGHRRASEAVASAAQGLPDVSVELKDCLMGSAPWFRWTYTGGYLGLVRWAPAIWGGLYSVTDRWGSDRWLRQLRRWSNARQARVFAEWLLATQPDVVIATHFFPVEVAAALKRTGRLRSRVVCVITDWLPHAFWLCPGIDRYAVATEATRQALLRRGIPATQVVVTGIPIGQRFTTPLERTVAAKRLGIDPQRFTILIGSGGFGIGPVETLVRTLGSMGGSYQMLVVAGRNEPLRRSVEALRARVRHPMMVHGFVHNMDEFMAASDLLISKAGGLTCAEAMAMGLPMIIVAPIPGQEARNSALLIREGAAIQVARAAEVAMQVERLRSPGALQQFASAARRLAHPDAARAVVHLSLERTHG